MVPEQSEPRQVPGHSDEGLRRLRFQSRYWSEATLSLLETAGLERGMRVLDLGCGAGDLTFQVASLVGPEGRVIGIDRAPAAVASARARAERLGFTQTRFCEAEIESLVLDEPVDAVVMRFVLMHLADPAGALRRIAAQLPTGTVVVGMELDLTTMRSVPSTPLYEDTVRGVRQVLEAGGVPLDLGATLWQVYLAAGLGVPRLQTQVRVEPAPAAATSRYLAEITGSLAALRPEAFRLTEGRGVSLEERLMRQLSARRATTVSPLAVGAWVRKPFVLAAVE